MILAELQGALILDKPSGVATHTPDGGVTDGFLEMASKLLERQLWAVHRLDKDTSGCLIVATTSAAVESWTRNLASGKKKYVFISPQKGKEGVWSYEGRVEKTGNHRFGLVEGEKNSQTTFAYMGPCPLGHLYEAEISTGKTHQIRLHAQASGLPILGDEEHGGEPFHRIMLHAKELQLEGKKILSPLPKIFEINGSRSKAPHDLAKFTCSLDRRRFLVKFQAETTNAFRLVHREWSKSGKPRLCVEKLGDVLQILHYSRNKLEPEFLTQMSEIAGCKHWFVREMFDRGKEVTDKNIIHSSPHLPLQWFVKENRMKLDLRYNQGLSSGLFLDQRENRRRVLRDSQGKKVANFFSYTCGFSVAAALGGAHEVVSVDTSAASLEWGKNNFKVNNIDPDKFEFFVADALFFLRSCTKRQRKFDTIILDPPTFSRTKHGQFRLNENLPELLDLAFGSLAPHGNLLITTNDETLTFEGLGHAIEAAVSRTLKQMVRVERSVPPFDFEFPLERQSVLKGYWVSLES